MSFVYSLESQDSKKDAEAVPDILFRTFLRQVMLHVHKMSLVRLKSVLYTDPKVEGSWSTVPSGSRHLFVFGGSR